MASRRCLKRETFVRKKQILWDGGESYNPGPVT